MMEFFINQGKRHINTISEITRQEVTFFLNDNDENKNIEIKKATR